APLPNRGYCGRENRGRPLTVPVIGKEEKRLVSDNRAANRAAELILHIGRIGCGEIRAGIQNLVAQVFVRFPVEGVRSSLRAQVDNASGEPAPFRAEVVVLHLEFGYGVLIWNENGQI